MNYSQYCVHDVFNLDQMTDVVLTIFIDHYHEILMSSNRAIKFEVANLILYTCCCL